MNTTTATATIQIVGTQGLVNHIHTCQTGTMAYCQERATDMVEMAETGAWIEMCPDHMLEALREGHGQPVQPIA